MGNAGCQLPDRCHFVILHKFEPKLVLFFFDPLVSRDIGAMEIDRFSPGHAIRAPPEPSILNLALQAPRLRPGFETLPHNLYNIGWEDFQNVRVRQPTFCLDLSRRQVDIPDMALSVEHQYRIGVEMGEGDEFRIETFGRQANRVHVDQILFYRTVAGIEDCVDG